MSDRRSVLRPSRHSFRKPWWRRTGRAWLLLALMLIVMAAVALLLQSAAGAASATRTAFDDHPASP